MVGGPQEDAKVRKARPRHGPTWTWPPWFLAGFKLQIRVGGASTVLQNGAECPQSQIWFRLMSLRQQAACAARLITTPQPVQPAACTVAMRSNMSLRVGAT